jgi:hypothetical protein
VLWDSNAMARNRIIKPELYADEKLTSVSVEARFLFMGLITFAEDMGRRRYNPARIKFEVFPADEEITPDAVDSFVGELQEVGIIELYEVRRKRYIRIPHFLEHQYVRKPSHCTAPPSPSEGPDAVTCLCANCKARNNGKSVPAGTYRTSDSLEPHQNRTRDALVPHSNDTSEVRVLTGIGIGIGILENQHTADADDGNPVEDANPQKAQSTAENRRTQRAALAEIAQHILTLLRVDANPNILDTLIRSIEIRARSRQCTVEAAGQEIAARAAWIAGEAAPEDWLAWFYDARYAYVSQGDKALSDRRIEARPVCGGSRCSEGWESVRVGDRLVSRRCPDCVKLWAEMES